MSTQDTVSILDGSEFVIGNRQGDLEATPTVNHGHYGDPARAGPFRTLSSAE